MGWVIEVVKVNGCLEEPVAFYLGSGKDIEKLKEGEYYCTHSTAAADVLVQQEWMFKIKIVRLKLYNKEDRLSA